MTDDSASARREVPESVEAPIQPRILSYGGDSYGGEYLGSYVALHPETDEPMGYVDYGYDSGDGEPVFHIKDIKVKREYQRRGVATALLRHLRHDDPTAHITPGMMTPDGDALFQAFLRDNSRDGASKGAKPSPANTALDQYSARPDARPSVEAGRDTPAEGPELDFY